MTDSSSPLRGLPLALWLGPEQSLIANDRFPGSLLLDRHPISPSFRAFHEHGGFSHRLMSCRPIGGRSIDFLSTGHPHIISWSVGTLTSSTTQAKVLLLHISDP